MQCHLYFAVAQIVDLEDEQKSRQRSVEFSDYGFVVSHRDYGGSSYLPDRNWTLTLTGISLPYVKMYFESYHISKRIKMHFAKMKLDSKH